MPIGLVGAATRYTVISSIVTAATSHAMVDLATVKEELNIDEGDVSADNRLSRYIREASKAAENYCNRVFVVETIKDQFFPQRDPPLVIALEGLDPLQLSRFPVKSVASVVENGATLTKDVDFMVDADKGQLIRLDLNTYPRRWDSLPIVVQFDGGFDLLPDDVTAAVIRMVVQRQNAYLRDPSLKSETVEGIGRTDYVVYDQSAAANMSADVVDLLDNYRIPAFA